MPSDFNSLIRSGTRLDRLHRLDIEMSHRLWVAERRSLLRILAILFAHSGDSWFWGLALLLLFFFGPSDWHFRASWMLIGMLVTALVVFVIKLTVRRSRPAGEWGQIYRRTDPHSFPSGHAARAMVFATLAITLGPAWFAWILFVWAPCVMLARVSLGVHYLSDVLAGALLGAGIGGILVWVISRLAFPV